MATCALAVVRLVASNSGTVFAGKFGFQALGSAVLLVTMIVCTILFVSSGIGLVLLKRTALLQKKLVALKNMTIAYGVIWFGTTFRCTTRLMFELGNWTFPEWYEFGLDGISVYFCTMCVLLFLAFSAAKAKYASLQEATNHELEASQMLMLPRDDGTRPVPPAYDI